MEKKITIALKDNSENGEELINRMENTVLFIIQQIYCRKIPKLFYTTSKPDIWTTPMESMDTNDLEMNDNDDNSSINSNISSFSLLQYQQQEQLSSLHILNNLNVNNNMRGSVINFANARGRIKMSRMMIILGQAYKNLISKQIQTKRSFYYELKGGDAAYLFKRPEIVDKNICHVANLLQCTTWDLGFIATSKGLVAGNLSFTFENGNKTNCCTPNGVLIPQIATNNSGQIVEINYSAMSILIVEKESIFQKLLDDDCPRKLGVIIITGKGYPDVATRAFVKMLVDNISLPVFILVDANPHGFEIMCVYKYGSINLWWENNNLICPTINWIGFYPSELIGLHLPRLPLTDDDKIKIRSLEKRSYINDNEREELKIMQQGKAEIESVAGISSRFLTSFYLKLKIPH
ncbi:hypothetical protein PV327_009820 [Microctonus hyperodae]|uniref:DNA topoisomerase (ATP-hydrolyzing) n=1 Tax=Microctonus hyperodae TaxID=165561 RepID=A0AA39F1R7_MICHY|nr:hypothetical protein PV327_009820 [Microctonus hyperodae]